MDHLPWHRNDGNEAGEPEMQSLPWTMIRVAAMRMWRRTVGRRVLATKILLSAMVWIVFLWRVANGV